MRSSACCSGSKAKAGTRRQGGVTVRATASPACNSVLKFGLGPEARQLLACRVGLRYGIPHTLENALSLVNAVLTLYFALEIIIKVTGIGWRRCVCALARGGRHVRVRACVGIGAGLSNGGQAGPIDCMTQRPR